MDKEGNVAYAIHAGAAMISSVIIFCSDLDLLKMSLAIAVIALSFLINIRFHS